MLVLKCAFFFLVFMTAAQCAFAYDFSAVAPNGQTLYYDIVGGDAQVAWPAFFYSGYTKPTGSLTIPSSVSYGGNTYSVTSISSCAFYGCTGLTSVSIPNSVANICNYAFYGCTGLTSVTIGNSVAYIMDYAFYGCSGLTSVTIPNSVTSIGDSAFYGCSGLTAVTIGNFVTSIGNSAFSDCTGLTTVNFNADSCFVYTPTTFGGSPFSGDTNISTINFGNSVTRIPSFLCSGLRGLSSVTITNSVITIGDRAFSGCSGLSSVNIGNSVTNIGSFAFSGCSGFTSVIIPNSVTTIGDNAFRGCSGLTSVTIPNSVTTIGDNAFYGCSGLTSVTIPNSVTSIGNSLFYGCSGLTSVTIPNSVTSIGGFAFSGCSGLTSVIIPNSVTFIGDGAFYGCSGLTSVTIPNLVTSMGTFAFGYCSGLTTVNFNVDSCFDAPMYGYSPFLGDTNITTINFGNSVTVIPSYLCSGLSGLTSVIIPNSVTSIGSAAFNLCNRLDTVWLLPNVPPSGCSNFPPGVDCFFVSCDAYNAYYNVYYSSIGYRNRLQIYNWPNSVVNISVNNPTFGTATIVQQSNHDVSCDSLCIISATSNYGYHFDHWNNGRTTNPDTLLIMGDSTIVAYFAPNQYIVEGMSYYSDRGHVSGSDTVNYLDTVVLTATAYYGYMFDHWSDGAYENPHSVVANGDRTIWAYFTPVQLSLSVASADEDMGTVSGGGNYDYHSNRTIRAIANTGYHFTHWNDGDNSSSRSLILTQDTSFTAYFAPNQYTLTLQSADETLGIVNGSGVYNYHDTVTISATAIAPHYHFESWSDNSTDNPRQVVVSEDMILTAYFSINVYEVVLMVDSLIHGIVSGDGNYTYGMAATVTATPFSGWEFSHWSDGATYNPYTFAVVQDTVLTAYFVREGSQNDIDSIGAPNVKILVEGQRIVVEGAEGNNVMVYDLYGRVLAKKRDEGSLLRFEVPATGTYLIRVGDTPARRVVVVR